MELVVRKYFIYGIWLVKFTFFSQIQYIIIIIIVCLIHSGKPYIYMYMTWFLKMFCASRTAATSSSRIVHYINSKSYDGKSFTVFTIMRFLKLLYMHPCVYLSLRLLIITIIHFTREGILYARNQQQGNYED